MALAMVEFNFDAWRALAETAPQEFESQRRKWLDELIEKSADVQRLRGLQFRVDMERRLAHASLGACVRLYGLMWNAFDKLNVELNAFDQPAPLSPAIPQARNNVIPFPAPIKTSSHPQADQDTDVD
jgi:hypothetical protein